MTKEIRKIIHKDMRKESFWKNVDPFDDDFVYLLCLAYYVTKGE